MNHDEPFLSNQNWCFFVLTLLNYRESCCNRCRLGPIMLTNGPAGCSSGFPVETGRFDWGVKNYWNVEQWKRYGCWGSRGWNILPSSVGIWKTHSKSVPFKQAVFHGKKRTPVFFSWHFMCWREIRSVFFLGENMIVFDHFPKNWGRKFQSPLPKRQFLGSSRQLLVAKGENPESVVQFFLPWSAHSKPSHWFVPPRSDFRLLDFAMQLVHGFPIDGQSMCPVHGKI